MPLSDDQKAMLRLLAQREQGYDDLAALMGLSVEEVRAKVKDALSQLEQEGEPAPSLPPEPPRAEPPPTPVPEPEPPAEPTPPAPSPTPPATEKPEPVAAKATAPAPSRPERPKLPLPESGGARAALAAGIAVLVALIVVLAISGGGDSGDATTAASSDGTASEETVSTTANPKLTQAVLSPVDGGDAKGLATFGRVKNELALQVEAEGLEPTGKGESYTIWLYESASKMLPLASTAVDESGKIGAQVQVPTEVLAYLASETFDQLDISRTTDATLKASLDKATREKKAPTYTGTDVLRGTITGPIIGAANKKAAE